MLCETPGNTLKARVSGRYKCQTQDSLLSDDVSLIFSSGQLILQAPHSVFEELFPRPKLEVTPPQPMEGGSANLSCQTRLPLERPDALLSFIFFRDRGVMLSNWSRSPELQITAIWREDSGSYWCAAAAGVPSIRKHSLPMQVHVQGVSVSAVLLETQPQGGQVLAGERLVLVCSVAEGTGDTTFFWHREDTGESVGSKRQRSRRAELEIPAVGESHAGRYYCTADNGHGLARSGALNVTVTVPASRPVLTLRTPRTRAVVGDVVELRCEAQRGSPPIQYRFYHEDVTLGSRSAPSGGGASFNLSLTPERSGNYACEADNGLGAQRSEVVTLSVTVPASRPVLTLRAPRAQAFPGDVVELRCEAQSGSPPILYWFYHEDVTLGSSSAPSGGGASFNLSLTPERSGNYACEADNGLGAQRSEAVPLSISGLTGSRSGSVATGVAGGLLSMVGLVVLAQLLYYRLPRRAGGRPTSDPSRSPSDSDPQEPTYYNVPGWMELQPVYSNVNPKGGDVVYSEVRTIQEGNRHAAASNSALRLLQTYLPSHGPATSQQRLSRPQGSSVIYSQLAESHITLMSME
nr:Fc receptor-like protein 3 [Neomonachus schauinslandi]